MTFDLGAVVAAIVTGIVGPLFTYFVIKRKGKRREPYVEVLGGRAALYNKASDLIHGGNSVIDTTWGPDAPELSPSEKSALEGYLNARRQAVSREGVSYRELFSETPGRVARLRHSAREVRDARYQVRVIRGFPRSKPVVDFMVVDNRPVLLSHVSSMKPGEHRFLYIRSESIAQLLAAWFEDCWAHASEYQQTA